MTYQNQLGDDSLQAQLPSWARAADYIVFLLFIIALTVPLSGGVRLRSGALRFTVTSPYRLVVWAALIVFLRHIFARQQPIHRHLWEAIHRWASSTPVRAAATTLIGTRLAIFLIGYLAVLVIGYPPGAPPVEFRNDAGELFNLPLRWDAGWYLRIARFGYDYSGGIGTAGQQTIVFFPALPMAMRIVAVLLGGKAGSYVLAGTFVSLTAFFCALMYVYLIARLKFGDEESRAALWLLAAFPFAYFYGAIYTESLFLLGAAGAFFHAHHRQYVRAGAWGLLVGLTKPNGFLLSVPLLVMAMAPWLPPSLTGAHISTERRVRTWASALAGVAMAMMPVVGTMMFSLYVWNLTGSPIAWAMGHAAWGRHYTGLAVLVTDRYRLIANEGFSGYLSQGPLDFLNAIGVVFVLSTVWPVARRLGLAYAIFIVLSILPPLAQGGMLSAGRLSSVLFPAFIWFASAVPSRHRSGWILSFAANQALNATLFYTWRPLF